MRSTPHFLTDRDEFVTEDRGPIRTVVNLSLIARVRAQLGMTGIPYSYGLERAVRREHLRLVRTS